MSTNKDHLFLYKLNKKEKLNSNFFRLISGLNTAAIRLCNFRSMKVAEQRIHEIRKTMKRSRAVLKLYRFATGESVYVEENALFRDISRHISDLRVGAVRIKTMGKLIKQGSIKGNTSFYKHLVEEMKAEHMERIHEMIVKEKVQRSIASILRNNRKRISHLAGFPCEFDMLSSGLKRMYRRCVVNLDTAMKQPSAENIHNFRKPVKYMWSQMVLLHPIWPLVFGQNIRNLDKLGERLGDEHDLAELEQYLWSHHYAKAEAIEPLILAIRKERKRIQRNVWPLSRKVFAETPAAFAKRVHAYWKVW